MDNKRRDNALNKNKRSDSVVRLSFLIDGTRTIIIVGASHVTTTDNDFPITFRRVTFVRYVLKFLIFLKFVLFFLLDS